jgi:hypothetical protein
MTPDTPVLEALTRLQGARGQALYARERLDHVAWETVWLIYDEVTRLGALGSEPGVEFHAGAFDEGGVVVMPILLRLGTDALGYVYDTWMNAYQIEGVNVYLEDLSRQDQLRIHLYSDADRLLQTLTLPNSLRRLAKDVWAQRTNYYPSTAAAFTYACERFLSNYADLEALWRDLPPC